jgi:hypothetical protein
MSRIKLNRSSIAIVRKNTDAISAPEKYELNDWNRKKGISKKFDMVLAVNLLYESLSLCEA